MFWVFFFLQEKPLKGKSEPGSGLPIKTLGLKKSQLPLAFGQALVQDNPAQSVLESSEAVTQLLNASPVEGQVQEAEWEEVIISEAHILANNVQSEEQGGATTIIQLQESLARIEPSLEQKERENDSSETANAPSPISHPTSAVKNTTG